jgi:hypothetical protein
MAMERADGGGPVRPDHVAGNAALRKAEGREQKAEMSTGSHFCFLLSAFGFLIYV